MGWLGLTVPGLPLAWLKGGETGKEADLALQVLTHYNGSFFHPDVVVAEVKKIDRRYSASAVRATLRKLAATGKVEVEERGRVIRYGINNPELPRREYWGESRQPRDESPHEDIIPMDPWEVDGEGQ